MASNDLDSNEQEMSNADYEVFVTDVVRAHYNIPIELECVQFVDMPDAVVLKWSDNSSSYLKKTEYDYMPPEKPEKPLSPLVEVNEYGDLSDVESVNHSEISESIENALLGTSPVVDDQSEMETEDNAQELFTRRTANNSTAADNSTIPSGSVEKASKIRSPPPLKRPQIPESSQMNPSLSPEKLLEMVNQQQVEIKQLRDLIKRSPSGTNKPEKSKEDESAQQQLARQVRAILRNELRNNIREEIRAALLREREARAGGDATLMYAADGQPNCRRCGDVGHHADTCPHEDGVKKCYKCLRFTKDHLGYNCPSGSRARR